MKKINKTIGVSVLGFIIYLSQATSYDRVRVVDGDTIIIGEQRIRLYGIDSVEKHQKCHTKEGRGWPCGLAAKSNLERIIDNQKVLCLKVNKDRYRRLVSVCYNYKFIDINAEMVRNGYAVAYTRYSKFYISEEKLARKMKLGIWSGTFIWPEKYRRKK